MVRQQLGPEFSDLSPRHIIADTVPDWLGWRDQHPVRRDPTIQAPPTFEPVSSRPELSNRLQKLTQIAWKGFSIKEGQEWCYVPFLVARGGTQPLAGAPEEADLTQVMYRGEPMEHYTNIHRIENLARSHPLVVQVNLHRAHTQPPSQFDTLGRATTFHQSPYDLKLTLAATGATMYMGFTVREVMHDLACIWWRPGRGMKNDTDRDMARAIFLDLAEIAHQQPHLGTQLQRAWEQGANVRPTQQADAAAGSSGPATPRPAHGSSPA